jgi:hypothetical protein
MFRSNHCNPRREMFYTDCCLNLVLPLSPRSPGSVGFDQHLFLKDIRFCIKFLMSSHYIRQNVKDQSSEAKGMSKVKLIILEFDVWIRFDIWILKFEIGFYASSFFSSAWCLITKASTIKITSSAIFVAWSAILSRHRATIIRWTARVMVFGSDTI